MHPVLVRAWDSEGLEMDYRDETAHRDQTRAFRRRGWLLLALLPLTMASLCQRNAWVPKDPPKIDDAPPELVALLDLDETRQATLDCGDQYCSMRFRIDVSKEGVLAIEIRADIGDEQAMRATLLDPVSKVLRSGRATGSDPIALSAAATPGPYFVLVQAIGGTAPFTVRAQLQPSAGAPRP